MRSWPSWPCHSRWMARDGGVEVEATAVVVQPDEVGLWTTCAIPCVVHARVPSIRAQWIRVVGRAHRERRVGDVFLDLARSEIRRQCDGRPHIGLSWR